MIKLTDILKTSITKINDPDPKWRNFVKDFRSTIFATAKILQITDYHERIFRYRLKDLLKEAQLPINIAWVIVWMNNIDSESNFKDMTSILIPDYQELTRIRNLYDGSQTVT